MKYSFAVLLLVGVISTAEARSIHQNSLAQQKAHAQALAKVHESEAESDTSSSSSDDEDVQLSAANVYDDGIVDALAPQKGACEERLWMNQKELRWQMDQFSRHLNVQNYKNAVEIAEELKAKLPPIHTWELLDKAFSFPRVRRYEIVQKGMDEIEHLKITSTLTSPTLSILRDSSRPPRESLLVTTPNMRMTKIPFTSDQFKQIRLLSIQITYLSLINIVY